MSMILYNKNLSLKEQLIDAIDEFESIIKQILEILFTDKKFTEKEAQQKIVPIIDQFNVKQNKFADLLAKVNEHRSRAHYIRLLEDCLKSRDSLINRIAAELKSIEDSLIEVTYQAEKKLKSVKQSERNRVFSEDVIRFAHLISKNHSVSSSVYWQQGDPARPFPTETHFMNSQLLSSRTQPGPFLAQAPMQNMMKSAMFNMAGILPQKAGAIGSSFSPRTGAASGIFPMAGVSVATGSPRGRPPGSGAARMSSPSPRTFPKILQRQQSPRFSGLMMPGNQSAAGQHSTITSASPSSASPNVHIPMSIGPITGGGFMSPGTAMAHQQHQQSVLINLPPTMAKQPQAPTTAPPDVQKVEQMSSDSSSTSSSEDETSPNGQ